MYILEAKNIHKSYAHHKALNDVSIAVPKGSIFGLLGPNGAGKTTLIRNINQITAPDQGEIWFDGERLQPKHIEQIGYLPEERGLYKKMKVGEQAVYLAQLKGLSKKEAIHILKEWFVKFQIEGWWDKKVEELSKGMQQKVQFIVTILHKPKMLIFDEPFSGFDPVNVNLLKAEILNLRDQGASIIFSTHNMSSVEELCDNIALINKSQVVLNGAVKEIQKRFKPNAFSIQYQGNEGDLRRALSSNMSLQSTESIGEDVALSVINCSGEYTANSLLAQLIPHVSIQSFHEILPSMNDIFIRTVESSSTSNPSQN